MTLAALIAHHRHLYQADLHIPRLVSRQPPTTLDPQTAELHVEPGAATGMPMSGRLLKYLSHPEGYGSDFPWSKALYRLKYQCRREHPYHRASDRPYWRGSLCHQLVVMTVIGKPNGGGPATVQQAARILRYDNPEPVLRYALTYIERTMDEARAKAERRAREDAGHGPGAVPARGHEHHRVPGLHQVDCPQCRRDAA